MYKEGQVLYRAQVSSTSNEVLYDEYIVRRVTPKGAWVTHMLLGGPDDEPRWVPLDARFCSSSKELAMDRLRARTRAYVRHARRRLKDAERRAAVLGIKTPPEPLIRAGSAYDY